MAGIPGCRSRFLHQLGTDLFTILPPPPTFSMVIIYKIPPFYLFTFCRAGNAKTPCPCRENKKTRPAFYGRPCVLRPYAVLSEKAHLTAFRQVAQSAHLTQAVDDAAANAGGLLQLLDGEVLLPMEGGVFQRIGGGTAQTFQ